jgi:hypothetical protein
MNVLVGCERSGIVRDAFIALGHNATSCDLAPSNKEGPHVVCDVLTLIDYPYWDLLICHPDCTYVSGSGNHWCYRGKRKVRDGVLVGDERIAAKIDAINFAWKLYSCRIPKICLENPIGILSSAIRKPDQIIHPWQFGENASKATCLWLKGLPLLQPTNVLPGGRLARRANQTPSGQNKLGPSEERAMLRAETYKGIADAMGLQWGGVEESSQMSKAPVGVREANRVGIPSPSCNPCWRAKRRKSKS